MPRSIRFRHALAAAVLALAMLGQGTWTLAGTTGGLSGTVVDTATNAPMSGVVVRVTAPTQTATATSDASGHFTFLSLAPDTYSVTATKNGYDDVSLSGIVVFADTTQNVALQMKKSLITIARVRSAASSTLVKSGTTADVYSVNAATQDKISALGGGGNLNSAYAAVASVPGAVMPLNQAGYFQTVHIRGGDYDQVGYEFDGVPVNRSFDNYPSGQLSSLGMSELQVYTGATPANSEGQGLAGYINQVIKTGTYPGFGMAQLGVGSPVFYHKLSIEAGGASPNRDFSYYVGLGGYDQDFRYVDQSNGGTYSDPTNGYGSVVVGLTPGAGCGDPTALNYTQCYANGVAGPGGFALGGINWIQPSSINDRDVVMNFHFALPHHNDGGRDDIQLLWDSAMLRNGYYESQSDAPSIGGVNVFNPNFTALTGLATDDPGPISYVDGWQWRGPVGAALPANASQLVSPYLYPDSPPHNAATGLAVNPNQRDAIFNNQEIVKLQYQKNFGSNAYARLYGYTYYSDWLQTGPTCAYLNYNCIVSPDYELSSHTRGASLQLADQINAQNLVTLEGNYTTAVSTRDNNTQMFNNGGSRSLAAILVSSANPTSGVCYDATGAPTTCDRSHAAYLKWNCIADNAGCLQPALAAVPATCGSGSCEYLVAENSLYATYNQVVPKFSSISLADQWRPSDRWLFNVGVRTDTFQFNGANTNPNDPARQFWFNAYNLDHCVSGGFVTSVNSLGVGPGQCSTAGPQYTQANLVNSSAQVLTYTKFQPRVSGTYTAGANTVFRFSGGEYVEPPNTAYEQYNTLQEDLADFLGSHFYNFGFNTPGHAVRPPVSYNYDFSWEQRLKGSDWSFKLTPFYRKTKDQIQNFFLDQATGFVSGLNVGRQTSEGLEFQLQKGDFTQNGLSGMLAFTYTHSYINYDNLQNGTTIVSQINNDIVNYNSYTSYCQTHASDARCAGGSQTGAAAPCYTSAGAPDAGCAAGSIANPYWNAPVQGLLNPKADYATYDIFPGGIGGSASSFSIPYAATVVLNYKHDRLSLTPTFQFLAGNRYGSPETSPGIDPASGCGALAGSVSNDPRYPYGAPGGSPYDAMTCPGTITIPNPYTHTFDQPGAFVNPSQFLMNLQVSYDVSPKITLVGTFANIINRCFGGSKQAWTLNDSNICSYGINNSAGIIQPVGNVYDPGAQIQNFVKYPYEPYLGPVNVDGFSTKMPFNFYLEARIKL